MKPKILSEVEQSLVEDKASPTLEVLCSQLTHLERSLTTQAQADDERINCLIEAELAQVFLSRPSSLQLCQERLLYLKMK